MKKTSKNIVLGIIVMGIIFLPLYGLLTNKKSSAIDSHGHGQRSYTEFKDVFEIYDGAFIGQYLRSDFYDTYVEFVFHPINWLYGEEDNHTIYFCYDYLNLEDDQQDDPQKYIHFFEPDHIYLMVCKKMNLVFFDHAHYYFPYAVSLDLTDQEYTFDGTPISVPSGQTIDEYVLSLHEPYGNAIIEPIQVDRRTYDNVYEKIARTSTSVVFAEIISVVGAREEDGFTTYQCLLKEQIYGSPVNTNQDLSFYLAAFNDTLSVGNHYYIGIDPISNDQSVVYSVTDRDTILADTIENLQKLEAYLE